MSLQRYAYFNPTPTGGKITLYRTSEEQFNYSLPVSVETDLSPEQQGAVASSMAWLQSQLAEGEIVSQVIFEPFSYVVLLDEEDPESGEIRTGLNAAVTGARANGSSRTLPPIDSRTIPGENALALLALWDALASLPEPT